MSGELKPTKSSVRAATGLRLAGASYAEIAEILEYASPQTARQAVINDLANLGDTDDRAQLRDIEGERLLALLKSVWRKATSPNDPEHLQSIRVAISIIERRSRLYGLDAPEEVIVHTPTMSEIDAWVNSVISTDQVIEGDVVV